ITGHGREGADAERIAFGDDAAAAGGLVAWEGDVPLFVADAVADPLAGVTAAAGVVAALASGGRWLLDVAMVSVAAHVAGAGRPAWAPGPPREAVAPTPPLPRGRAGPMGADTDAVLAELGIG